MGKGKCLWSDVRAAVPLEDMQSAYYGYSIVESRVWVNGVVGLGEWGFDLGLAYRQI